MKIQRSKTYKSPKKKNSTGVEADWRGLRQVSLIPSYTCVSFSD